MATVLSRRFASFLQSKSIRHLQRSANSTVIVNVDQGQLKGKSVTSTETGGTFYSFKGVPFAKPPVGDLRFKEPQPFPGWTGVRDALQDAAYCPQGGRLNQGSEDCLYLNVYTPRLPVEGIELLPVMVRIHGGGLKRGGSTENLMGPDFFMQEGIVMVTFNYRLCILGFLNVGDSEDVRGNMGLKDQAEALRWVKRNIATFGGDPDKITLGGDSAGGCSTELHMISPMTRDLFRYAYSETGSCFTYWSYTHKYRQRAFRVGEILGLKTENSDELVSFLRKQPIEALLKAADNALDKEETFALRAVSPYAFLPTAENSTDSKESFLTEDPKLSIKEERYKPKDYLIGWSSHEGLIGFSSVLWKDGIEKGKETTRSLMTAYLLYSLGLNRKSEEAANVLGEVKKFLFSGGSLEEELLGVINWHGDLVMRHAVHKSVQHHYRRAPLYMYEFGYDGALNLLQNPDKPLRGASHADQLGYLLKMDELPSGDNVPPSDKLTRARTVRMWSNFVKTGRPCPDNPDDLLNEQVCKWKPVSENSQPYLSIDTDLTLHENLRCKRMEFWDYIYDKYSQNPNFQI